MIASLNAQELRDYIIRQCDMFFPDKLDIYRTPDIDEAFNIALERTEECFRHITLRGYAQDGEAVFSHVHSDQYSQFLYYFSNSLWHLSENKAVCDRIMFLNRALSGAFVSYKCELPAHFLFGHPVGSVIGNASYGDFLVVFQNVTINTGQDGISLQSPVIGEGLFCGAGAKIIGTEPIGRHVSLGVNACVYNKAVPDNHVVVNCDGKNEIRLRSGEACFAQRYFDIPFSEG